MSDRREGWVITVDHFYRTDPEWQQRMELSSREGYGQVSADQVREDGGYLYGRRVTVETGLTRTDIADPVPFRTCSDDGPGEGLSYSGVISRGWLEGDEELAFAPLRFAETDVGDVIMQYMEDDGSWETL